MSAKKPSHRKKTAKHKKKKKVTCSIKKLGEVEDEGEDLDRLDWIETEETDANELCNEFWAESAFALSLWSLCHNVSIHMCAKYDMLTKYCKKYMLLHVTAEGMMRFSF